MGEIIRFVPKSERERARLIRQARGIYDKIFPPGDSVGEEQNKGPLRHMVGGANTSLSAGGPVS
jgi:hypothetical protein